MAPHRALRGSAAGGAGFQWVRLPTERWLLSDLSCWGVDRSGSDPASSCRRDWSPIRPSSHLYRRRRDGDVGAEQSTLSELAPPPEWVARPRARLLVVGTAHGHVQSKRIAFVQSNDGTGSAGVFGVYEIPQQALEQVNSVEKCQFHWFAQYTTRTWQRKEFVTRHLKQGQRWLGPDDRLADLKHGSMAIEAHCAKARVSPYSVPISRYVSGRSLSCRRRRQSW